MRIAAAIAVFIAVAGASWAMPAGAADLEYRGAHAPRHPLYCGYREPWSVAEERPPRKCVWLYTSPLPPGVNPLVPVYGVAHRPAPWTSAWYAYCAKRWPSFNPRTGTIRTPDGTRMCI